jgi:hypothetical protein
MEECRLARRTFFSFHFKPDSWRAGQVRNMGIIEGNTPVSDNDWEEVKKGGDKAVTSWINNQMRGRSCTIVLVGEKTAGRKWIKYEIKKSWNDGKGLVGICIHNLKDQDGEQSKKGKNPFDGFTINKKSLSKIVKLYDLPYKRSKNVYDYIKGNIEEWVEEAIAIRSNYGK